MAAIVLLVSGLIFPLTVLTAEAQAADTVTVFGAASMTNAITEIGTLFSAKTNGKVVSSFAASSTLAKQIENGAPANIFISADEEWMDYLAARKLIVPDSRFDVAGNRLALIAAPDSTIKVSIGPGFGLRELIGDSRLAMGDPDHVPAGKYAKAALQKLKVWDQVLGKIAAADNVRAALTLVERGECPLGIVFATDAAISKKVKIVGLFPEDSHAPIIYPAALVSSRDTPSARSFLEFLKSGAAGAVFEKYGFVRR